MGKFPNGFTSTMANTQAAANKKTGATFLLKTKARILEPSARSHPAVLTVQNAHGRDWLRGSCRESAKIWAEKAGRCYRRWPPFWASTLVRPVPIVLIVAHCDGLHDLHAWPRRHRAQPCRQRKVLIWLKSLAQGEAEGPWLQGMDVHIGH